MSNPISANATPMSARSVMTRAWALVRQTYGTTSLRKIGRKAFAWCLRRAWREAKDIVRRVAPPQPYVAPDRLTALAIERQRLEHSDAFTFMANARLAQIAREIAALTA